MPGPLSIQRCLFRKCRNYCNSFSRQLDEEEIDEDIYMKDSNSIEKVLYYICLDYYCYTVKKETIGNQ